MGMIIGPTSKHLGNLSVFITGKEQCAASHHASYILPDRFLMHYIISGKGIFRTGGKEYALEKGNIFLIGNQYGYYEADASDPWTYTWINFSGEAAEQFLEYINLSTKNPVYTTTSPDEIEKCFEAMLTANTLDNDFLVYSSLFNLLGKIQETNVKSNNHIITTENQYVEQCLEFIHINYYRNIGAKEICAFVSLEYSYLFRLFKEHMKISPVRYLTDYRLSRAAYMLENTSMTVNEISSAVGFKDRAAFSKAFSRKYAISPSNYRKHAKN